MYRLLGLLLLFTSLLEATPSNVFWTYCTTDVYAPGVGHIDEDNYFTVFNHRGHGEIFPPDTGLEFGVFSWKGVSVEAGVDFLGGIHHPLYFNIGAAIEENRLFCHAPAVKIGLFNIGTRSRIFRGTSPNVADLILGKSLPEFIGGRLCVGGFIGNHSIGNNRLGFMVSYVKPFCPKIYCDGTEYHQWVFCADYASGKNTIGGGGFGLYYYFTPNIDIVSGPVWFNSTKFNGYWKWTVQLNISFSVLNKT